MLAISIAEVQTVVKYNRSEKTWEAINGKVSSFATKPEAELAALRHDVPEVYQALVSLVSDERNEKVTNRAVRAGFILRDGLLREDWGWEEHLPSTVAVCQSQSQPGKEYDICLSYRDDTTLICECQDYLDLAPRLSDRRQIACKHVLAVILKNELAEVTR